MLKSLWVINLLDPTPRIGNFGAIEITRCDFIIVDINMKIPMHNEKYDP